MDKVPFPLQQAYTSSLSLCAETDIFTSDHLGDEVKALVRWATTDTTVHGRRLYALQTGFPSSRWSEVRL